MKATIMIAAYNHEQFIRSCLESCVSQSYKNIEVIVVDDCSPDGTADIVQEFCNNDSRVILHRNEKNLGEYGSRNVAIRLSTGDLIAYLDSDDMLAPVSIERRAKVFAENPMVDVVCGKVLRFNDKETVGYYDYPLPGPGIMIRRRVFEQYGLFYTPCYYRGDREYWLRTGVHPYIAKLNIKKSCALATIPEVCGYYRMTPGSNADKMKTDMAERKIFKDRITELITDGITKENTEWL